MVSSRELPAGAFAERDGIWGKCGRFCDRKISSCELLGLSSIESEGLARDRIWGKCVRFCDRIFSAVEWVGVLSILREDTTRCPLLMRRASTVPKISCMRLAV